MKNYLIIFLMMTLQTKGISQTIRKSIYDFLPVNVRLGENMDSCKAACNIYSIPMGREIGESLYPRKVDYIICKEFSRQFLGMKIQNIYLSVDSNKIKAIQIFLFYQHGVVKKLVDKFGTFSSVGEFLNGNSDTDENAQQLINDEHANSYIWRLDDNLFMILNLSKNQFRINYNKNSPGKDSSASILAIYDGNIEDCFQLHRSDDH